VSCAPSPPVVTYRLAVPEYDEHHASARRPWSGSPCCPRCSASRSASRCARSPSPSRPGLGRSPCPGCCRSAAAIALNPRTSRLSSSSCSTRLPVDRFTVLAATQLSQPAGPPRRTAQLRHRRIEQPKPGTGEDCNHDLFPSVAMASGAIARMTSLSASRGEGLGAIASCSIIGECMTTETQTAGRHQCMLALVQTGHY
jgi:hypothetical protein